MSYSACPPSARGSQGRAPPPPPRHCFPFKPLACVCSQTRCSQTRHRGQVVRAAVRGRLAALMRRAFRRVLGTRGSEEELRRRWSDEGLEAGDNGGFVQVGGLSVCLSGVRPPPDRAPTRACCLYVCLSASRPVRLPVPERRRRRRRCAPKARAGLQGCLLYRSRRRSRRWGRRPGRRRRPTWLSRASGSWRLSIRWRGRSRIQGRQPRPRRPRTCSAPFSSRTGVAPTDPCQCQRTRHLFTAIQCKGIGFDTQNVSRGAPMTGVTEPSLSMSCFCWWHLSSAWPTVCHN
jgi:hypothetical protein